MLRKKIGVIPQKKSYPIMPIGTDPKPPRTSGKRIIGHLGVLKKSQGLDLLFDSLPALMRKHPDLTIEIVGSGPEHDYFKQRAQGYKNITFYGFVKNQNTVNDIIRNWSMGTATYVPEKSNGAYWTDPSKIKAYISQSVPTIMTKVNSFSREIHLYKAGIVVDYFKPDEFVRAVGTILRNEKFYKNNAFRLAQQYNYRKIYTTLIRDVPFISKYRSSRDFSY